MTIANLPTTCIVAKLPTTTFIGEIAVNFKKLLRKLPDEANTHGLFPVDKATLSMTIKSYRR